MCTANANWWFSSYRNAFLIAIVYMTLFTVRHEVS